LLDSLSFLAAIGVDHGQVDSVRNAIRLQRYRVLQILLGAVPARLVENPSTKKVLGDDARESAQTHDLGRIVGICRRRAARVLFCPSV
jgi:hypothetical protein